MIEIGPGRGALTFALAERVDRILAVEVDRDLARNLRDAAITTLEVVEADFLDLDLPTLAARIHGRGATVRIVGNLPYNVSTEILLQVLRGAATSGIKDAVFMLQREVAARVIAGPGSGNYGPLAVTTMLRAEGTPLLELPPGAFRPAPRVWSTLLALRFREPPRLPSNLDRFEGMVRTLFTQRRKQLVNALPQKIQTNSLDSLTWCQLAKIDPKRRPSDLTVSELIDLWEVLATTRF